MHSAPPAPPVPVDAAFGGIVFCDLVFSGVQLPRPGAEVYADGFVLTPGGTANRAVATARLGLRTALLAVLGRDLFGNHLLSLLAAEENLDLRWVQQHASAHTALTVAVTDEHDRSFITYEEPDTAVPAAWPGPAPASRTCHVSVAGPLPAWVAPLRRGGTTVFGGVGWDASHRWSPDVLDRLGEVDVFVPNEVEATSYTRTGDPAAAARVLAERVGTVVVTRGGRGAIAVDAGTGEWVDVPAVAVRAVDPTGAGDVFTSGLMTGTVLGWDLATRVRFAGLVASLSVRTLGGATSAPRPRDVLDFLERERPAGDFRQIHDWAATGRDNPPEDT
ncbi:carbohydrate kinase family protein [Kineococcus rubinsiae]|uniref:carbohydrate kinase family protein n=1 Tax=Kineococcus rubinsiae TaxID=2609562 RepID=UPI001431EC01|nr:PfkB family carbohydrate kinase [Kineococcus rubinsiae]